jgi:hypothetical protein
MRNSSIQWVLILEIIFWKYESLSKVQLPKWESTWECVGSFPRNLLHSRDCKCDFRTLSTHTFPSPCLGCEPKAKVATSSYFSLQFPYIIFSSFSSCSPKLSLFELSQVISSWSKQQEFRIQTNKVPWLVLILTTLFIQNDILILPP